METIQPKLRFPEFNGEWKTKRLSEVSKIGRGKSKHRPRDAEFLYGGEYPFIQTGDIRNADLFLTNYTQTYSEAGLKQSKLWDENTLCITIAANIAETTILQIKACFPDSIIGLIPNENDTTVLFVKYQFDKFKIEIQNLSQGVAQANLNQEKLSNIVFNFPSLEEQTKIANFLSSVDEKINLLKEKKSLLEDYKKGIMQKIFNQQIRFKDDNDNDFEDWEDKKMEEVVFIKMGQSPNSNSYNNENIGLPLIQGNADINNRMSNPRNWTSEPTKVCEIGDLILTVRAPVGAVAKSNHKACIGRGVCSILNKDNSSKEFIFQFLLDFENKWSAIEQGSTFTAVSGAEIKNIEINLPSIEEQTKIANFLSAIDEKIELVSNQIQDTQEYKKGLLQQMFV